MKSLLPISRRRFLELGLGLAAAGLTGCVRLPIIRRRKIVIVGAGLAGLASALELRKLGHEVVVLEASGRAGGRVFTQRKGFLDGQFTELGATRIPDVHALTLAYAREMGLALDEFPGGDLRQAYLFEREKFVHEAANDRALPRRWRLHSEERRQGLDWLKTDYLARAYPRIGNPRAASWAFSAEARALDKFSYAEYLAQAGASPTSLAIQLADGGSDAERYSAAAWIAQGYLDKEWGKTFRIRGGNDRLPAALAERLRAEIRYRAPVEEIAREGSQWRVRFRQEGMATELAADAVVLTVSPVVLRSIRFRPGLSEAKAQAVQQLEMASVTKVSLAVKRRFWQDEKLSGLTLAYTDSFVERLWDLSHAQEGAAGLLVAYVQHRNAERLSALPVAQQVENTRRTVARFLPGIESAFSHGSAFSWQQQAWVGGAWVSYGKQQLPLFVAIAAQEPGGLHFAGDHTSLHCGWQQGAFASAQRVVEEIHGG